MVPYEIPSITFGDITQVIDSYIAGSSGETVPCEIILVEKNRRISLELDAIDSYLYEHEEPDPRTIMSYFDTEMNRQVHLLLPEWVSNDELLCYEVTCVEAIEYYEPYGDVMARFTFATPYIEGQPMVTMLALPNEEDPEDEMTWLPLHTEVNRIYTDPENYIDYVEITFSSSILTPMMEETALLLILSTPTSERAHMTEEME